MTTRLYELFFDPTIEDQWHLGNPVDPSGEPIEGHVFAGAGPLDVGGELFIPAEAGHPLDVTLRAYKFVVTERIGSLLGDLAPKDLQRIPARVESREERYEVLNVLSRIDCIDRDARRPTYSWRKSNGRGPAPLPLWLRLLRATRTRTCTATSCTTT